MIVVDDRFKPSLVEELFDEGRTEGKAEAILVVLEARGLPVSEETREQIVRCEDLEQLESWLRRAAVITGIDSLFEEWSGPAWRGAVRRPRRTASL